MLVFGVNSQIVKYLKWLSYRIALKYLRKWLSYRIASQTTDLTISIPIRVFKILAKHVLSVNRSVLLVPV